MKVYRSKEDPKRIYFPISRYIKIRGWGKEPYFMLCRRRVHISELECLTYPIMVEDPKDGKLIVIGYHQTLCNIGGRLYEIHPDGEYIRVWDEMLEV